MIAAGSLKAALGEVARDFRQATGTPVETTFCQSSLMFESIENGAVAHVFASANMAHPRAFADAGKGGAFVLFARNRLCGLRRPCLEISSATLLDVAHNDATRFGTSTPGADPSGDYAWQLFGRAEAVQAVQPGAQAALEAKALQLTGGSDSTSASDGRNICAWVMESDQADLFLTNCTNAVLAQRELPELQIVTVPEPLSVGADYGLIVLDGAPEAAWRLAFHILSPESQRVPAGYSFDAPGATVDGRRVVR